MIIDSPQTHAIVDKVQHLIASQGTPEEVSGAPGPVLSLKVESLQILMTTPSTGVKTGLGDYRYQVEIWEEGKGKVFGASWDPEKKWADPFQCWKFKKGDWIDRLLCA